MTSEHQAELDLLDAAIAEADGSDAPSARWRAADALFDKALLIERRETAASALPLYADVARRLEGADDPGPRALRICALNAIAQIQDDLGFFEESRAVAEALVADHFDDPPDDAVEAMAAAAILLAKLRHAAGEPRRAVQLLDEVDARYGRPGMAGHERTRGLAQVNAAWVMEETGEAEASIERYGRAVESLSGCADPMARRQLARALARQASVLYDVNRFEEARARCHELLERFSSAADPRIADEVAWAREMLEWEEQRRPRRFGALRRPASGWGRHGRPPSEPPGR